MLKLHSGDYAIVRYKGKAKLIIKLDGGHRGVLESSLITDDPEHIDYAPEDVMCNLGQEPKVGNYCGVTVRPYIKTIETKRYGPIHICRKIEKKDISALNSAMKTVFEWYAQNATTSFLPLHAIYIYPPKGKYAGMYVKRVRKNEIEDEIHLFAKELSDVEYNKYVIAHEFAHGLWFRCVDKTLQARWVKLYQRRLKLSRVMEDRLTELWDSVLSYDGTIREYQKEIADDSDSLLLKDVIKYFKRVHHMDVRAIDTLLQHDSDLIGKLWPTSTVLTEERSDLTEYAMTNTEEFFAEAVAYQCIGKKLPKDIRKALKVTFRRSKAN
jgi:hypothetical protein